MMGLSPQCEIPQIYIPPGAPIISTTVPLERQARLIRCVGVANAETHTSNSLIRGLTIRLSKESMAAPDDGK